MEEIPVYVTTCGSSKKIGRRAVVATAATTWLIGCILPAFADPILLRGDEDTGAMLHGQATIAAPALPPGPMGAPGSSGGMPPLAPAGVAAGAVAGTAALGAGAAHFAHMQQAPQYRGEAGHHDNRPVTAVQTHDRRTYFQQHPKVRAALLGAGVGTAAGAVTGLITHKGVVRGAAIGAGAGAGVGLIRSSDTLKRHPIVKDLATGAVAGLGLGLASHHRLGKAGELGAVGAAVGLGVGVLRDKLK
jgi:hypothetical protein